jgi:HlyD family secretion protein
MDRGIFRKAAIERLSTPDRLDQPVRITPVWAWMALWSLLVLVTAGAFAAILITVPEKVPGNGIVIAATGILEVPFPAAGRVAEIHPRTGDKVRKGDIVARIEQPELRRSHHEARKAHHDLREQRRQVAEFHDLVARAQQEANQRRRRDLEQSHALIRRRLGYLHERAGIDDELGARRLITRAQVVDTRVAIGSAEEELATVERQINEIALDAINSRIRDRRELLELDLKVEAALRYADLIEQQLRHAEDVISPYSGTVAELKHDVGRLVHQGAALMTVLPDGSDAAHASAGSLRVVLFVPGADGKRIEPGMTVEVTPSTVRREEHGFMFARVIRVAHIPATVEGMLHVLKNQQLAASLSAGGAPFAVDVELLPDHRAPSGFTWSSAPGPETTISPGTLASGRVWVRRLRLIEFAIPATRGLFNRGQSWR